MVNTEILVQAKRMGFRCKEVPVTHFPREHGEQSGANLKVVLKAFRELMQLRRKLSSTDAHRRPASTAGKGDAARSPRSAAGRTGAGSSCASTSAIGGASNRRPLRRSGSPVGGERVSGRRLRVAMVAAGPFPANHGTPGSIKEMAARRRSRGARGPRRDLPLRRGRVPGRAQGAPHGRLRLQPGRSSSVRRGRSRCWTC